MKENFTVISFGNYETKILICTFIEENLFPIYKKSFLTKNCFQESEIIDEELLIETLDKEFKKIPISLKSTNLILNIPLKNLEIVNSCKEAVPVSSNITKEGLIDLVENFGQKNISSEKTELDKKIINWKMNNKSYSYFPNINGNITSFGWNINTYLVKKSVVEKYKHIFEEYFNLEPKMITCDSLVMNQLFLNKERKSKILINIGHLKSSFERYENGVLVNQTSYDFGIRHLTSEIGKIGSIDEEKSIELLKIYKSISSFNKNLALINHFKEKYMSYSQTTIQDIKKQIFIWIKNLIYFLNYYTQKSKLDFLGVDEIYIFSSMNILDSWFPYIRENLEKRADIFSIKSNVFSIKESKYCSLIASIMHYINTKINGELLINKIYNNYPTKKIVEGTAKIKNSDSSNKNWFTKVFDNVRE